MTSQIGERAIQDALRYGKALLKFISPNDTGITGSHQCGYYLPSAAWEMYTTQAPSNGLNHKHSLQITWQDGRVTDSTVTWYGKNTRHEYRLTKFGRDFPHLTSDSVGNLLVLIPITLTDFLGYVLDLEEDIIEIQAALGTEVIGTWGIYNYDRDQIESENDCIDRIFRKFAGEVDDFPSGNEFSLKTRQTLIQCIEHFASQSSDKKLMKSIESEYNLFKLIERRICDPLIHRLFPSVEEFIKTAASIMNRRKSRAGRSFENHVAFIFEDAGIPFVSQPAIDGKPDIVIPSVEAYRDGSYPLDRLFVLGLKTTCKDRWRQVLNEGTRVPRKYLLTMQRGISPNQLREMASANVSLIVPKKLHRDYPASSPMELLDIDKFIEHVRCILKK